MNPLLVRLLQTLVTAILVYLMGYLSAHIPAPLYNLANDMLGQAGGMAVVSLAIATALAGVLFALYQRVANYVKTKIALRLPQGSSIQQVQNVYSKMSLRDVVKVDVPTPPVAKAMSANPKS